MKQTVLRRCRYVIIGFLVHVALEPSGSETRFLPAKKNGIQYFLKRNIIKHSEMLLLKPLRILSVLGTTSKFFHILSFQWFLWLFSETILLDLALLERERERKKTAGFRWAFCIEYIIYDTRRHRTIEIITVLWYETGEQRQRKLSSHNRTTGSSCYMIWPDGTWLWYIWYKYADTGPSYVDLPFQLVLVDGGFARFIELHALAS